MKIYDKKGFATAVALLCTDAVFTAVSTYVSDGTINFLPSAFIVYSAIKYILGAVSEEKSRINIEREQQKNRIVEEHYGTKGKVISNLFSVALIICCLAMCLNFTAGLVMCIISLVLNGIIFKPVNAELRKINEEANQRKSKVKQF